MASPVEQRDPDPTSGARRIAVIATATVLGGMIAAVGVIGSDSLEPRLTDAGRSALRDAGFTSVQVRFDGREALLSGPTATEEQLVAAERVIEGLDGVRWATVVDDMYAVAGAAVQPALSVRIGDGPVTITGTAGSSDEADAIEAAALAAFGPDAVVDITVESGVGPVGWLTDDLFAAIAPMQAAALTIGADGAEVEGSSPDPDKTTHDITGALNGIPLDARITGEPDAATAERLEQTEILFGPDSIALTAAARAQLSEVAGLLTEYPELRLVLTGHIAIPTGTIEEAIAFSEARALAVVDELERLGVAASRLAIAGAGTNNAVGDNTTDDGAARNRRVTIAIEEDD